MRGPRVSCHWGGRPWGGCAKGISASDVGDDGRVLCE